MSPRCVFVLARACLSGVPHARSWPSQVKVDGAWGPFMRCNPLPFPGFTDMLHVDTRHWGCFPWHGALARRRRHVCVRDVAKTVGGVAVGVAGWQGSAWIARGLRGTR